MNLLNCLGLGYVTATKDTNTDEAMVYVPALFPHAEGRGMVTANNLQGSSLNDVGESIGTAVMSSNSIPAKWLNMSNNNRITSPDVREGSVVAVYNVTGSSQYYWTYVGVNNETFRLETVLYGWNANPNIESNNEFNIKNFYIFKVDTREGLVALRTSDLNGEKTRFEVILDAKEGNLTVVGDHGSYLCLDDIERSLTYTNQDESIFKIDKKTLVANIPDTIDLVTTDFNVVTKNLRIKAENLYMDITNVFNKNDTYTSEINKSVTNTKTLSETVNNQTSNISTLTEDLGSQTSNISSLTVTAASTSWKGDIEQKGNIEQVGGITNSIGLMTQGAVTTVGPVNAGGGLALGPGGAGGSMSAGGDMVTQGAIESLKTITAAVDVVGGGKSLRGHIHPTPEGPSGPPS